VRDVQFMNEMRIENENGTDGLKLLLAVVLGVIVREAKN